MIGLPGYLLGCFSVLPGSGVRCSRSYREGGHRTSLPTGPDRGQTRKREAPSPTAPHRPPNGSIKNKWH